MAQQLKVLATKPSYLSLCLKTHMVEGGRAGAHKRELSKVVQSPPQLSTVHMPSHDRLIVKSTLV